MAYVLVITLLVLIVCAIADARSHSRGTNASDDKSVEEDESPMTGGVYRRRINGKLSHWFDPRS